MKVFARPATLLEIAPFIQKALQYDTSGGMLCMQDFEPDRVLKYKAIDETGAIVGGCAMTLCQLVRGKVAWVEAAAGRLGMVDFTRTFLPEIEREAQRLGATQVAMLTKRMTLKQKLMFMGYATNGEVFRKDL